MKPSFSRRCGCLAVVALLTLTLTAQPRLEGLAALSGDGATRIGSMALDASGNIYLTGTTTSADLATPGAYRTKRTSSILYAYSINDGSLEPSYPTRSGYTSDVIGDPRQNGEAYALTPDGLLKTTDSGATWALAGGGLPPGAGPRFLAFAPSQPDVLYVLFAQGIYRSTDSGRSWSAASPLSAVVPPDLKTIVSSLAIDPFDAAHVLAYGYYSYDSRDGGQTWRELPTPLVQAAFDPLQRGVVCALVSEPSGPGFRNVLVRSTDGGSSFQQVPGRPVTEPQTFLLDGKRAGRIYISGYNDFGTDPGIYRSEDNGASWALGISTAQRQFLQDTQSGEVFAVTGSEGILRSTDGFRSVTQMKIKAYLGTATIVSSGKLLVRFPNVNTGDAFVAKLDPAGRLQYFTYIGALFQSSGNAITVDSQGRAIVGGFSSGEVIPNMTSLTGGAPGSTVLFRLSRDGSQMEYATWAPGGTINALALDAKEDIYLGGTTGEYFYATPGSAQPYFTDWPRLPQGPTHNDGFMAKITRDGDQLVYSTFMGYGGVDRAWTISVDSQGNAYAAGTRVWKLNADGSAFLWSTTLQPGEILSGVIDREGNYYVCGATRWTDMYTTPNAFQHDAPPSYGVNPGDVRFNPPELDGFVAKFDADGGVVYSTLLGGSSNDSATRIALDENGQVIVAGYTRSTDFPVRNPMGDGPAAAFLTRLNADGSDVVYSTYMPGDGELRPVGLALRPGDGLILVRSPGLPGTATVELITENLH